MDGQAVVAGKIRRVHDHGEAGRGGRLRECLHAVGEAVARDRRGAILVRREPRPAGGEQGRHDDVAGGATPVRGGAGGRAFDGIPGVRVHHVRVRREDQGDEDDQNGADGPHLSRLHIPESAEGKCHSKQSNVSNVAEKDGLSLFMIFRLCEISGRYPHGLSVQHDATDTFGFVSNTTKIQAHTPRIMKAACAPWRRSSGCARGGRRP